jgi:hypothetical protein
VPPPSDFARQDLLAHPLSGHSSVADSARMIRHYRYAVERMMRILGGWIALTPEISAKLLMGRHVWDNAQHADALGRRLPELRAQAHVSEPANEAVVAFIDAIEEAERPEQTVERLVGVYRVLKPHLLASYAASLELANAVYEPPTRRILARCAEDEQRHVAAGLAVLRHFTRTSVLEACAERWQARLEKLLIDAGGVTGRGLPPVRTGGVSLLPAWQSDDAEELIQLEQAGGGWAMAEDLEAAVRSLGDALVAQDQAGLRRYCLPGMTPAADVEVALAHRRMSSHRIVALASVGRQRLVKLRLDGSDGTVVLVTRWVPGEGGWRVAALDLAVALTARPV